MLRLLLLCPAKLLVKGEMGGRGHRPEYRANLDKPTSMSHSRLDSASLNLLPQTFYSSDRMLVIRTRWWTLAHTHVHTLACPAQTPPHPSPPPSLLAAFTAPIKCLSLEEVGWDPLLLLHFSAAIEPWSLGRWTTPQSPLRLMRTVVCTSPLAGNCGNKTSCCQRQFPLKFCTRWFFCKICEGRQVGSR